MSNTLKNVSRDKLLELPVTEEMQMGMSTGLALGGHVPVSIYPRWNFLLCAVSQVVSHLDKLSAMSDGGFQPKVIIRTGIGSEARTGLRVDAGAGRQRDRRVGAEHRDRTAENQPRRHSS